MSIPWEEQVTPETRMWHGESTFTLEAGDSLEVRTKTPGTTSIFEQTVPAGRQWLVTVAVQAQDEAAT